MNRKTQAKLMRRFAAAAILALCAGCPVVDDTPIPEDDADFETLDWTDATHGKGAALNYAEVFDDTQVKRFDIVITPEYWQTMLDDMTDLYGAPGAPSGRPGEGLTETANPVFVPTEIFYNNRQWYKVGVRFKGNSSLQSSWRMGIMKLSFKLDFDEFEDEYPQIKNQRFHGFKKLSLKNNYLDQSFLREKAASEIFASAGLAVSRTAFYEVYVDHGDGPIYFGLYTLVEEVDDTVIETQFSKDGGNLYKPEGEGASFAAGTFDEEYFEKKANEEEADWSDIQTLFDLLHDGLRTTDPATWRANLETVFDTETFLRYLAVNTVIQNWDTYGLMTQNYFLYNNPETGTLTWIPWDTNEALQEGMMGGALNLDFSDIQRGRWPLIEYLYGDEVYRSQYDAFVLEAVEGPFEPGHMQTVYEHYAALIEPYAAAETPGFTFLNGDASFQAAVDELIDHAYTRSEAAIRYLNR